MGAVLRIELVSGTGRDVGLKTIEPATRLSGGAMGNSSLVGVRSAYNVAGRLTRGAAFCSQPPLPEALVGR
jgi:hypothetical protein